MAELLLVSKCEAERTLSICVRTLDSLIAANEVPVRRLGGEF